MLDENYQDLAKVYKGLREKIENDIKVIKTKLSKLNTLNPKNLRK